MLPSRLSYARTACTERIMGLEPNGIPRLRPVPSGSVLDRGGVTACGPPPQPSGGTPLGEGREVGELPGTRGERGAGACILFILGER
jgi:hypothetical protein